MVTDRSGGHCSQWKSGGMRSSLLSSDYVYFFDA